MCVCACVCQGNRENQELISKEGAISSLVSILGTPVAELQANTAQCLGSLCEHNPEQQALIARTGAIAPLCTLIKEGGADDVKEQSASAVWALAENHGATMVPRTSERRPHLAATRLHETCSWMRIFRAPVFFRGNGGKLETKVWLQ